MFKKRNRKKSAFIALLVILAVMSSTFVWTLARYVTSQTATDSAAVAKFGLGIPSTINLFSDSYTNVKADEDGKKIIAPGTSGEYQFQVTGTSEVAYKVEAEVKVTYSAGWGSYQPLRFSLNNTDWMEVGAFQTSLSNVLASEPMAPNTAYASTQKIYWSWPFEGAEGDDAKDTAMGVAAAGGNAPTVEVEIEVIAAQID